MRLTTRLFLLISFLIALTVGTAVAATWWLSARTGREAITERLVQGDALRRSQDEDGFDRLRLVANLFVADANLIAYVAEAQARTDTASILDLLLERQEDLGFDFAVVTDPDGYLLARTDQLTEVDADMAEQPLIAQAVEEYESAGLWVEEGRLYRAVVIPLVQGGIDLLGFFATAYQIDDASALESKRLDGSEVAVVLLADGSVLASSFYEEARPAVYPRLAELAATPVEAGLRGAVVEREVGGESWLLHRAVLTSADDEPVALRLTGASLRAETAPFRKIGSALAVVGLLTALLGFLLTYGLARRLTRPLASLVSAARAAREGNFAIDLPSEREDEVGELGREFDELLTELREKRDMETYVAELSRNLPDAAQVQETPARSARTSSVSLLVAEYRHHAAASPDGDPATSVAALDRDLRRAAERVAHSSGTVVAFAGHRILAVFEGAEHSVRALKVALELIRGAGDVDGLPAVAVASDRVTLGAIEWESRPHEAVCGRSVQLLETLLREASPGEVLLPTATRDLLLEESTLPVSALPERQGITTAIRYCTVDVRTAPAFPTLAPGSERREAPLRPIFQPGQVVAGRFEVLALVGTGGMGVVYRAKDRKLGDVVALKTLRDGAWRDHDRIERLKQEIKIARKITHPHVLRVYDLGEVDDIPFISMEYVRGVTLRQLLDRTPRLPFSAALRLGRQVCQGLEAVHEAGILHQDMKPDNVLLEPTGNARLMDFGIASPLADQVGPTADRRAALGTPYYMAPEQLSGGAIDVRADIFGTGVLLFELFTGGRPFRQGKNVAEVLKIKLEEQPLAADAVWPEVPRQLAQILARCLEKSPEERFPGVRELLAALDRISA